MLYFHKTAEGIYRVFFNTWQSRKRSMQRHLISDFPGPGQQPEDPQQHLLNITDNYYIFGKQIPLTNAKLLYPKLIFFILLLAGFKLPCIAQVGIGNNSPVAAALQKVFCRPGLHWNK
jgi:hypothetical protein